MIPIPCLDVIDSLKIINARSTAPIVSHKILIEITDVEKHLRSQLNTDCPRIVANMLKPNNASHVFIEYPENDFWL